MIKKFRYSILATLTMLAMTAGLAGGCVEEAETIEVPYVEWA